MSHDKNYKMVDRPKMGVKTLKCYCVENSTRYVMNNFKFLQAWNNF